MEKVVKRALGYGKPKENEDFTHVIFTRNEYSKNIAKIRELEETIKKLECDYSSEIDAFKKSKENEIIEIKSQADSCITEAQAETNTQKDRADSLENINRNLIRVATERANAKRGLTPKKEHDGYVFLSVEEYTYNCECFISGNSSKTTTLKLPCFRVRLQSPYVAAFEIKAAKDLIYDTLLNKLCKKMGVDSIYKKGIIGYTENEVYKIWNNRETFIFKLQYKANFQKGFWELDFLSRYMPIVSPDMIVSQ